MNAQLNVADPYSVRSPANISASRSGVSWAAVFAGAAGAAALSLVLLILGTGLGLSSVSPWTGVGASAATLGASTIAWLAFTQIAASAVGGYLAGRLRVKWVDVHTDEVYFRDTAHGFLAWAIASLGTAALLTATLTTMVGSGVRATTSMAGAAMNASGMVAASSAAGGSRLGSSSGSSLGSMDLSYSVDSLFRVDPKNKPVTANTDDSEVTRIFARDLLAGQLSQDDQTYVAQVVAQRTGTSQANAEQRVNELFTSALRVEQEAKQKAQEAADAARKATAYASLWMVVALLAGAFCASLTATLGGRLRDKIS